MSAPKISVIMPVLDINDFFWQAVDSVCKQTFSDWELVIITTTRHCGADKIALRKLSEKDSRIRIIYEDANLPKSANRAVAAARAEIIARMDSDDICEETRFETQYKYMDSHPEIGVLGSNCIIINPRGKKLGETHIPLEDAQLKRRMYFKTPFLHPTVMMRKALFEEVEGYDETLNAAEDYELWSRLWDKTKFHNLEQPLVRYRKHGENTTIKKFADKINTEDKVVERLEAQMQISKTGKIARRVGLIVERYFGNKLRRILWR